MKIALDTNVLSSLWSQEPTAPVILEHLDSLSVKGSLVICGAVYAELLAHPKATETFLEYFLNRSGIKLDLQFEQRTWTEAGLRYGRYAARHRRSSAKREHPRRILADFLIGAHALLHANRLVTLDPRRYAQDFPELRLHAV